MNALHEILRIAENQGCRIERGKRNHFKIFPPQGEMIAVASTPSDHRSIKDVVARLRRAGIVVGPRR